MHVRGFLIPVFTNGEENPVLLTIFNLIYWGIVLFVVIDVIKTVHRIRSKRIKSLTFDDYKSVLNGKIQVALTPMWMDRSISDFNQIAIAFNVSMDKILNKNVDYVKHLKTLESSSEEYGNVVEAEYFIANAMIKAASDICAQFGDDYHEKYHIYAECPISVIQKYCSNVLLIKEQNERIINEEFVPPELKDRYLLIMKSIMALIDIINSNIQIV